MKSKEESSHKTFQVFWVPRGTDNGTPETLLVYYATTEPEKVYLGCRVLSDRRTSRGNGVLNGSRSKNGGKSVLHHYTFYVLMKNSYGAWRKEVMVSD